MCVLFGSARDKRKLNLRFILPDSMLILVLLAYKDLKQNKKFLLLQEINMLV